MDIPTESVPVHKTKTVLEGIVCARHHHNLESFKQALVEAEDNFPIDAIHTAINAWPNRLWRCIRANSGHFE